MRNEREDKLNDTATISECRPGSQADMNTYIEFCLSEEFQLIDPEPIITQTFGFRFAILAFCQARLDKFGCFYLSLACFGCFLALFSLVTLLIWQPRLV